MAQFAIHVATGIFSGDKSKGSTNLKLALISGNIMPDLDFIPMLLTYPFSPKLALLFHRSFTHNLFLPLCILLGFFLGYRITNKEALKDWGVGLAVGITTHIILDVLFWFDQVQILWPLDLIGYSTEVDLWKTIGIQVSDMTALFVAPTLEFLMYTLFFYIYGKRITQKITNKSDKRFFSIMTVTSLIAYFLLVGSIFILPPKSVVEISYGLGGFIWGPITIYTVWKYRKVLTENKI